MIENKTYTNQERNTIRKVKEVLQQKRTVIYKATERYAYAGSDWRAVYGSPEGAKIIK